MHQNTLVVRALASAAPLLAMIGLSGAAASAAPALGAAVKSLVDSGKFAGAVALVASRDKVLGVETAGYADLAARRPMRPDDLFWIASMSKPFTATAVMMLVDEGRVGIDDPVEKYLPEFKDVWVKAEEGKDREVLRRPLRPITVRNLLSHTSGLVPRSPLELPHIDALSLRDNVRIYPLEPLVFEPGSRYQYSNAGINTAGRIVEVVSGMPFEKFLQERIFTPLGMKDTTFWPSPAQVARLAKSYQKKSNEGAWEELPVDQLSYPLTDRRRGPCPAGGLFSTAEDVSLFGRMILGGGSYAGRRYLSRSAVTEMTSVQTGELPLTPPSDAGYGFGWLVPRQIPGHPAPAALGTFGHGGAYSTQLTIDPARGLVTVLMVQRAETPAAVRVEAGEALRRAVLADFGE